ncbi:uncharacterized protein LOC108220655 [Daucus carota subsp. sativus]|uniref:uncharacterized protein LOC108220655 n=1 Tax=Daucus carota subsp. sativus TaxID=79200 RepID=UPI0007EF1221|nr:PREDICTED: uncharacterized protein LOC108220655 [Daucus carota subsp. sativus]
MKDDDVLPVSTPTAHMSLTPATSSSSKKYGNLINSGLFGRGRYKFWALAAILLLAFWSMLTGTVTLRLSTDKLNRFIDDIATPVHDDLDVLEMEEREKVVKHMWDVYTNSRRIRIPRFWQEAFEAAYEELTSDIAEVREAAISEIANMSMNFVNLETPPSSVKRPDLKQSERDKAENPSRRKL